MSDDAMVCHGHGNAVGVVCGAERERQGDDMVRKKQIKRDNGPARPMPADEMRRWRNEMGWSERDAADRIGINRTTLRNAERDGATLCVALACAAVAAGLKPWGIKPWGRDDV